MVVIKLSLFGEIVVCFLLLLWGITDVNVILFSACISID